MQNRNSKILEALHLLDPSDDAHWTSDGLPLVDIVSSVMAEPVKRQEITAAAPTFQRGNAATFFGFDAKSGALRAPVSAAPGEDEGAEEMEEGWSPDDDSGDDGPDDAPAAAPAAAPEDGLPAPADDFAGVDIMKMPVLEVMRSASLTERAWAIINARLAAAVKLREETKVEIDALNAQADLLSRMIEARRRDNPDAGQDDIRAYLARSAQSRDERAVRARRFVEAGTTAGDVAKVLRTAAPIDAAMARKTGLVRGSRPVVPFKG